MDFAALPPEVNSARMYAGPGSGPMMAAAAAWSGLAAELSSATTGYQEVVSELTSGAWHGPSATLMAAAAAPYVEWMGTTAAQAEQAAGQARAAAAAYEAAFAATVPPPVIATNRATLESLVATNVLGQNSAAIAANQAEYAAMWAQDTAAMYGYASSSAAATTMTPFSAPPQNTNPAGAANQAAATAQSGAASTTSAALHALAAPTTQATGPIQTLINAWLQLTGTPLLSSANQLAGSLGVTMVNVGAAPFNSAAFQTLTLMGMLNAGGVNGTAWGNAAAAAALPAAALSSDVSAGSLGATLASSSMPVSAGVGEAASIRGLSVPPSWAAAPASMGAMSAGSPFTATALPSADLAGLPPAALRSGGWSGDRPLVAAVINAPRKGTSKSRVRARVGRSPAAAGKAGAYQETSDRWLLPSRRAAETPSALSNHERKELEGLRNAVGELTKERDAAARLIRKEFRS